MIDSANFRMADRLAQGDLVAILTQRRKYQSLNQLARGLFSEFGIEVTGQTVAIWCQQLDIHPLATASTPEEAK